MRELSRPGPDPAPAIEERPAPGGSGSRVPTAIAISCGAAVLGGAAALLVAWRFREGSVWLTTRIKPNACLSLALCGAALLLLAAGRRPRMLRLGRALALLSAALTAATLAEWASGVSLGLDQLAAADPFFRLQGGPSPGRMAPNSALALFLCSLGLALIGGRPRRSLPASQRLLLAGGAVAWLALLGYLSGAPRFYAVVSDLRLGQFLLAGLLLLVVGAVCARPDQGLLRLLRGDGSSAFFLRRVLPVGLFLPALLGFLTLRGQQRGLYDAANGSSLLVAVLTAVLAAVIWASARSLDAVDRARTEAQAQARRTELSVQRLFETGVVGMVWFGKGAVASAANETFLSLLGYQRADLLPGLPLRAFLAKGQASALRRAERELLQRGVCRPFELVCLDRGGRLVPVLAGAALHHARGSTGVAFVIDLRGQKREEAALRLLSSASAALSASLQPDEVAARVGHIAVPALAEICLVDLLGEADGPPARAAVVCAGAADAARVEALRGGPPALDGDSAAGRALAAGRPLLRERPDPRELAPSGAAAQLRALEELRPTAALCAPLVSRGHAVGVLTLITTARSGRAIDPADLPLVEELARRAAMALDNARLYRAAETASRLKDEFVATVSHELRSPLHAMLGWVRLLRAGQLPPSKQERALETIERNARAQAQLVEDLLDVSRITSGKLSLELGRVELVPLVENVVESMRPSAEQRGVSLRARTAGFAAVRGDPDRLSQVLSNLVGNAIKFTPQGRSVEVALRALGGFAEVTVRDEGIGVSAELLPHVFERFRQAGGQGAGRQGGLGLGLAIARQLVELHGGTVRASSDGEGKGAAFIVRLPCLPDAAPLSSGPPGPEREFACPPELRGLRILVVEDEVDIRDLIAAALERCGARVQTASCPAEAFVHLRREPPELIVSDIAMPGEDGYSFIGRVRALPAAEGGAAPALAITARASPADRERALEAGFQAHLAKPVGPSELLAAIAALAPKGRA